MLRIKRSHTRRDGNGLFSVIEMGNLEETFDAFATQATAIETCSTNLIMFGAGPRKETVRFEPVSSSPEDHAAFDFFREFAQAHRSYRRLLYT